MGITCSEKIKDKLQHKHGVSLKEVYECFLNREGPFLEDIRELHKTNPATQWFLAKTDKNRLLKVIFIEDDGEIILKSAYEPSEAVRDIYLKYL